MFSPPVDVDASTCEKEHTTIVEEQQCSHAVSHESNKLNLFRVILLQTAQLLAMFLSNHDARRLKVLPMKVSKKYPSETSAAPSCIRCSRRANIDITSLICL